MTEFVLIGLCCLYGRSEFPSPLFACLVDLQKPYDSVQHDLLWARLTSIGVSSRMLAAVKSLYAGGGGGNSLRPYTVWHTASKGS